VADPRTIQQIPAGLLGLLRITGGDTPNQLADLVGGVLELHPYYVARTRADKAASVAGRTLTHGGVQLIVPQNEYWLVESMSSSAVADGAGPTVRYQHGYQLIAGGNLAVMGVWNFNQVLTNAGDFVQIGTWLDNRLLLPPGSALAAELHAPTIVSAVTMTVSAVVTILTQ